MSINPHIPPSSDRLEKSVLSCLFQHPHVEGEEALTPEHFHMPNNRRLYDLITTQARPLDLIVLTQKLVDQGAIDEYGGPSFITEIYTYSPSTQHFKDHVKELHQYKARRYALRASYDLMDKACDLSDSESFINAAGPAMTEVIDIASAAHRSREKKEIMLEMVNDIEARIRGEKTAMGYATGIAPIDQAIKGLHPARLCIVSGYPTSGKTVLAVQMLWNLAMQNIPSLFISLEMPDKCIAERNLIIASGLPCQAITEPHEYAQATGSSKPTRLHLEKIRTGLKLLKEHPIFFEDPPSPNLAQIVSMIRRNVRKRGIKAVGIDYLQLVKGSSKSWSKENEMAEISHTFQSLAKELKISILLLSQQNQQGATKYAEAIAEDADAVLTICQNRDKESDDFGTHTGIGVRKDRHYGNTGDFLSVILDKVNLKFVDNNN